jgi:hypothetical protein
MGSSAPVAVADGAAKLATGTSSVNYNRATSTSDLQRIASCGGEPGDGTFASATRFVIAGVVNRNGNRDGTDDHSGNDLGIARDQVFEGPLPANS